MFLITRDIGKYQGFLILENFPNKSMYIEECMVYFGEGIGCCKGGRKNHPMESDNKEDMGLTFLVCV